MVDIHPDALNRHERRKAAARHPFGWEPWTEGTKPPPATDTYIEFMARQTGATFEQCRAAADAALQDKLMLNNVYQVAIRQAALAEGPPASDTWEQRLNLPGMIHLSIKRRDRKPVGPERFLHFQRIKNDLVGPEHEAVELYPAESRLVDCAHQYHLWCSPIAGWRFPFGFVERFVVPTKDQPTGRSKSREATWL